MSSPVKRILLISADSRPETYRTTKLGSHPIGLMYIAAAARKVYPELEIKIYQTITRPEYQTDLPALIQDFKPDLVGMRALSFFGETFSKVSNIIRATQPDCPIIGGGPHVSTAYEELLKRREIDLAVIGEGENTFVEIIRALNADGKLPSYLSGTAVSREEDILKSTIVNPERPRIPNLDENPWPAYDLINLNDFSGITNMTSLAIPNAGYIEASRGCPYKCFYCHIADEKLLRQRSSESVVAEMKHLHRTYGIDYFIFLDDIFNVPIRRAKETLRVIAKELPNVRLSFQNGLRADQMDDELLDLLEMAGTIQMAFAVETVTQRLQKFSGKALKLERALHMIEKASPRFITTCCFMMGFPTETYEEVEDTIRFAASLTHVFDPVLSVTRVYRNSLLWRHLNPTDEQGRLIDQQTRQGAQTSLFSGPDNVQFYGDFFSDDVVPLKSKHIQELHTMWLREIQLNPQRINDSYGVLRKFLSYDEAVGSYRALYNDARFNSAKLDATLKFARQQLDKKNKPANFTPLHQEMSCQTI